MMGFFLMQRKVVIGTFGEGLVLENNRYVVVNSWVVVW